MVECILAKDETAVRFRSPAPDSMIHITRRVLVSAPKERVCEYLGTIARVSAGQGGYERTVVRGPLRPISSTFSLKAITGGTWLTHEEQVPLPFTFKPLRPLLRRWIERHVERELASIKEEAERLHRRRQLESIEKDVAV